MRSCLIHIFFSLFVIFFAMPSHAQKQGQAAIDSMLKDLPKAKEDTNKVNLLNGLSFCYHNIKPDEGIKYGQQALDVATKLDWKKGIAGANNNLGNNYTNKSDYPQGLEYYQKALKLYEEIDYNKGIATANMNIGVVYAYQSDNQRAVEYFLKALKIDEEQGYKQYAAMVTNNIGYIYESQSDYPKALDYYFKALKIDEEQGYKQNTAVVTGNIGRIYFSQTDYPKALEYYFRSLKMCQESGNKKGIANATDYIGAAYIQQADYPKGLEYMLKALKMYEEMGDKNAIAVAISSIGSLYSDQKNYTMAVAYWQKSLKIDEEIGNKTNAAMNLGNIGGCFLSIIKDTTAKSGSVTGVTELTVNKYKPTAAIPVGRAALLRNAINYLQRSLVIDTEIHKMDGVEYAYENLAEAYKLSGDYKKAMEYADNTRAIKDSVFSKENGNKIAKLENDRKQYGDSLKAVAAKRTIDIKAEHRRNYELIGAGVIVLLLGFTFIVTRNNKLLDKEKKRSDNLLLNILPEEVASQLKDTGAAAAKRFDDVTVLFTDFVNFTEAGERMKPEALIEELHTCFKKFDEITGKYGVEKIKTIGDAYLAVAGLPSVDPQHAEHIVRAALDINTFMQDRLAKLGNSTFAIRIGIHSGSVVAGIVGVKKFAYDIWGDTVNTAARMEQNSEAGKINISQTTYELVKDKFSCEYRGEIDAKGKGMLKMYYVS